MSGIQPIQSSLRRVARPSTHIHRQCRNFTSSRRKQAAQGGVHSAARNQIRQQMGREKTMQSRMREARGNEIPDDLGYFPKTLIKPESKDLPSLLSSKASRRFKIEWTSFRQRVQDFFGAVYQMKWAVKRDPISKKRMQEDMELASRYYIARDLHKQLYIAFAKGDRTKISEIACTGLQSALRARLDHRRARNAPEESWSIRYKGWTPNWVNRYWIIQALCPPQFKSTQILADRRGALPIGRDGSIRQVTVKIRGEQTLAKSDGSEPKTRYVEEYIVIQKMKSDGEEGNWMIWGTTQPSTEKEIDELFSNDGKEEMSWIDRVQTQVNMQKERAQKKA